MKALLLVVALIGALGAQDEDQKNRPVTKVVNLLKDMAKNLQKEQEEDEAVYNKLACWCKTNDKAKTESIADAESSITQLVSNIEENTALSAKLGTEIKNLNKEIAQNQEALQQATELRKKELAEFNGEEKDNLQSISAMKSAITVLSKHHPSKEALVDIAHVISHIQSKHSDLLTPPQQKSVSAFVQAPQDFFDSEPVFKQSYAPQSGEIFGILRNMLETFEANLSQSQKDEMEAQSAFESLKAAKLEEISNGEEHVLRKKSEKAETDSNLAQMKTDLSNIRDSLSADQKFLMNLKEKCQVTDQEWEQRQQTRAEETTAISEAIGVLSNDDAHDTFSRTFNPSFVQTTVSHLSKQRETASRILSDAALRFNKPQLATLATKVRLDAFTKVKKAIDDMINELLKQKSDEIKHKDFCISELNQNDKDTQKNNNNQETTQSKIDTLVSQIDTLKQTEDRLMAENEELRVQLKKAGEDRELENKDFQTTVADQRSTQELLNKALNVLKGFYNKKGSSLLQQPAGPPPPASFKTYKKQGSSGGVMGLIEQIISDAKVMVAEATTAETAAQQAYETFVQDTNESLNAKNQQLVETRAKKADREIELSNSHTDLKNFQTEHEQLQNSAGALHKSCDFVVKNFDNRQTARDEEVEALRQAKSIISGANFQFLQRRD